MRWLLPKGPLIVLDEAHLSFWGGISNVGGVEGEGKDNWVVGEPSDYGRACEIKGWIDKVHVRGGEALVLWGEPLATMVWQGISGPVTIVRGYYAENDDAVLSHLNVLDRSKFKARGIPFRIQCPRLHLFDAALPGKSIIKDEFIFELTVHNYDVITADFQADNKTKLILHFFEPRND